MEPNPHHGESKSVTARRVGLSIALLVSVVACSREPDVRQAKSADAPRHETTMTNDLDPHPDTLSPNFDVDLWRQGVDFFADGADGADGSWSLLMDFDSSYVFTPAEGAPRRVRATKPDQAQDADVARYRSVTDEVELIVTVHGVPCESRPSLTHRVHVDVKESGKRDYVSYQGCGRYVIDPRLNDIWALTAASGQAVDPSRLPKGTPVLEFHIRDRRVLGHTGCNALQGSFAIARPGTLRFSPLVATQMQCPDAGVEERLLAMLSGRELRYSLGSGRLSLEDSRGGRLDYRKVD